MPDRLIHKLERLYRARRDQMFLCALQVTGRRDLAEDAVHEAFVRLFNLQREPRRLRAYVFRAVRNAAIDQVRRSGKDRAVAAELADLYTPPDLSADQSELSARLVRAIAALDPERREVVILRLRAGLRFREIAQVLDLPHGTVSSRYRRGIENLREALKEYQDG